MTDRLLTLRQFAQYIAVSKITARRIIDRSELPVFRVGGQLRVKLSDVELYLEANRIERTEPVADLKALVARAVERAKTRRAS